MTPQVLGLASAQPHAFDRMVKRGSLPIRSYDLASLIPVKYWDVDPTPARELFEAYACDLKEHKFKSQGGDSLARQRLDRRIERSIVMYPEFNHTRGDRPLPYILVLIPSDRESSSYELLLVSVDGEASLDMEALGPLKREFEYDRIQLF